uniref:Uncharacterized protein n=1 Tax=Anguilla anguilla TaxID=7936 RepID=A0A0E9SD65_ANGAN
MFTERVYCEPLSWVEYAFEMVNPWCKSLRTFNKMCC